MAVQRIWRRHNLKPHLLETFKLSKDTHFVEKLEDVVGLYLNPPDKALVLCVDEKSQIQALDRTRPMLPLAPGVPAKQTHDYKRNGTTTLFAALSMLDGAVVGECMARHRHQEFIRFLNRIDKETPATLDLHLIVDNYATHKHPKVKAWLKRHPRFHLHFTPTSSSWLNMVERWFRNLTDQRLRRGTFNNVATLIDAITDYIAKHNLAPKAFVWSAPVKRILDKVNKIAKCIEPLGTLDHHSRVSASNRRTSGSALGRKGWHMLNSTALGGGPTATALPTHFTCNAALTAFCAPLALR
jgi:transposase